MNSLTRRRFIELLGHAGAGTTFGALGLSLAACSDQDSSDQEITETGAGKSEVMVKPAPQPRVVIVGGGFGGATCAKYLRRFAGEVNITLIERDKQYVTCPFSNTILAGINDMDYITHRYDRLQSNYKVSLVNDTVNEIDADSKKLVLAGGKSVDYDWLVLSPGIDFRWDAIEGYDETASETVPHAWKAGIQTHILRKQLEAMEDGGLVIIAPPGNPFRCPPGPYERASMIAHYLKTNKPKSKILILDQKDKFSKQPLFTQAWEQLYPGMIEWVKGSDWGGIERVDAASKTLYSVFDKEYQGSVINLIPPQKAGAIAHTAGLVNADGWCPVDQRTFESTLHKDIHVIGDASIAGQMPKSGFAANSQAKVCAAAIAAQIRGIDMPEPSYVNTCYSLISPDYGISVAAVYRLENNEIMKIKDAGGVSPKDADDQFRKKEAEYTVGWYQSITSDIFS